MLGSPQPCLTSVRVDPGAGVQPETTDGPGSEPSARGSGPACWLQPASVSPEMARYSALRGNMDPVPWYVTLIRRGTETGSQRLKKAWHLSRDETIKGLVTPRCLNSVRSETSAASPALAPRLPKQRQASARDKSSTATNDARMLPMVLALGLEPAKTVTKCQNRTISERRD